MTRISEAEAIRDIAGLILDTSILIESERRREGVEDILRRIRSSHGEIDVAISTVSVVELTRGIYRTPRNP
jgi:predicted nucleic acid-binding protein